jgi:hypothetical protein
MVFKSCLVHIDYASTHGKQKLDEDGQSSFADSLKPQLLQQSISLNNMLLKNMLTKRNVKEGQNGKINRCLPADV